MPVPDPLPLPNLKKTISRSNWTRNIVASVLEQGPIPEHIAFIMDGNRRFSRRHGMEYKQGHYLGGVALEQASFLFYMDSSNVVANILLRILAACFDVGVKALTVNAFSIENFKRPAEQVDGIWSIIREMSRSDSSLQYLLRSSGARLQVVGRLDLVLDDIRKLIEEAVDATQNATKASFNLCVAYTSRDEITRAVRRSVVDYYNTTKTELFDLEQSITSQMLSDRMDTAGNPPVDVLVRTSGVYRLSDFLLWQCHQDTDIHILDTLWPEFELYDLWIVILRWQRKVVAAKGAQPKL
ncbi:dehydrodolichyl diphosphate syntase complex subunit SPAC4D7.04c [Penicillium sp. IBT 16267x]|nr:dehydrodolichyl diphosphate syntase complex subunit SPAC4D7.04c [Penicillium sp. IBT 16267x]